MPTRRNARACAPSSSRRRAETDGIVERRTLLVAEIAQLREAGASPLIDKAQQLLTRWWSSAGWTAREKLLHTVRWLIDVERSRRDAQISA